MKQKVQRRKYKQRPISGYTRRVGKGGLRLLWRSTVRTVTSLPPPGEHRPRCFEVFDQVGSVSEIGNGFPGCIMFRVANPFDEVFDVVATSALVEDDFNFKFVMVIDGDGRRRKRSRGDTIRDGGRGSVGSEEADVEYWVNVQRGG